MLKTAKKTKTVNHFNPDVVFDETQTISSFVSHINQKYVSSFCKTVALMHAGKAELLGGLAVHVNAEGMLKYTSSAKIVILAKKPGYPSKYRQALFGFAEFSDAIRAIQSDHDLPGEKASQFNFAEVGEGLTCISLNLI